MHKLSTKEREWLTDFLDEHYGATPRGISTPEQVAETNRLRFRLSNDLFAAGLRSGSEPYGQRATPSTLDPALDSPKAQELLAKIRAVRPTFDAADGRKRARFASPMAERRFYRLRDQLRELLEGGDAE